MIASKMSYFKFCDFLFFLTFLTVLLLKPTFFKFIFIYNNLQ